MNPITSGINADHLNLIYGASGNQFGNVSKSQIGPWSDAVFSQQLDMKVQSADLKGVAAVQESGNTGAIKEFILAVDEKDKVADTMRASILSGESNNLHQTMIASQEASVSFSLMIEMRNKVMETYQELMRLQI